MRREKMTQWQKTHIKWDGISFISELLINQSFVSDEERTDNTPTENAKINTNENESIVLDICKDVGTKNAKEDDKKGK